jgi:hypothetical protein
MKHRPLGEQSWVEQQLKTIWIGIDPGNRQGHLVSQDELLSNSVLEALGETTEQLKNVLDALNAVLKPRFDDAVLSGAEFYC